MTTDRTPAKEKILSEDGNRAAVPVPFGIACYEGSVKDGYFTGHHVGIANPEDAEKFINGEDMKLIRVFNKT